jgi:hypothetical protein
MPESENPLIVALKAVFGPLVKQSSKWPPVLAYGLPGIVAVLLIVLLRPVVPINLLWLVGIVILAPLVGYIITDIAARRSLTTEEENYSQTLRGLILEPRPNQTVKRTINCSGSAVGIRPGMHLWLAVESNGFMWPKEAVLQVDRDHQWQATIFEDGASKRFSIALLVADPKGDAAIRDWLEAGKRNNGTYAEIRAFSGTVRIARVDGLRLSRTVQ